MDKHARLRWAVLLSALAATIGAIFYPVDVPFQSRMSVLPKSGSNSEVKLVSATVMRDQPRSAWVASDDNPFGPRTWDAPPPVTETTRVVQPVDLAQPAAEPEAPPPALPYRFLGRMQDGGNRIIYLGRGEDVILAHLNDVLDGNYKVVAVNDNMIEFESVQSGIRQTLPIPAQ